LIRSRLIRRREATCVAHQVYRDIVMLDLLMIIAGLGFFEVAILYTIGCEKM
jgi:hypothetical protein